MHAVAEVQATDTAKCIPSSYTIYTTAVFKNKAGKQAKQASIACLGIMPQVDKLFAACRCCFNNLLQAWTH